MVSPASLSSEASVFAIDPGITTGWAFIAPYDCLTNIFNIQSDGDELLTTLTRLQPKHIVIERMPQQMDKRVAEITAICEKTAYWFLGELPNVLVKISPGEWKPVTGKEELPWKMKTQHERDAYRLGRYFLYKYGFVKRA